ncbi:MAG: 4Fe-4S dicluster domain-containing protein, partial [Bacteroidia bacterium]|nr:4Fe-4S dicluster domain-containing protein [Bacteroidia bacterium]
NYYASSYNDGNEYASILVKTREGRPIKIDGNELSSINNGTANARVQASVLSLYDGARFEGPMDNGTLSAWSSIDQNIEKQLADIAAAGGAIRIVSATINSPSTKNAIADFIVKYPTAKHLMYDAVSYSGMTSANQKSFGKAVVPHYHFENADVIVSFGADFLGNWISPTEFSGQYAKNRKVNSGKKTMSKHYQVEANMSLTGSNADERVRVNASEMSACILALYNKLQSLMGGSMAQPIGTSIDKEIEKIATDLQKHAGKALVVSGSNNEHDQTVINAINALLKSYGSTIDLDNHSNFGQGLDKEMVDLMSEMNSGNVKAVMFLNANPVYSLPNGDEFKSALDKVDLKISFATAKDETAAACNYICPSNHYLESWGDAEPYKGMYSLVQPTIQNLFDTRQAEHSLLKWSGSESDYYTYLKKNWSTAMFGKQNGTTSASAFWNKAVHDGVFEAVASPASSASFGGDVNAAANAIAKRKSSGMDLEMVTDLSMGNGNQANNPWLQEMPDPISRVTWDNYLAMAPAYAAANGINNGDVVTLSANGKSVDVPALLQPGMAENSLALAVGYGRKNAGKVATDLGVNAYQFMQLADDTFSNIVSGASVTNTGVNTTLASIQDAHTLMGREIVKETTLEEWVAHPDAGNHRHKFELNGEKKYAKDVDLWATEKHPEHPKPNHHWGMSIDLNACTGCGACVVACQAENNVPVVGKQEVANKRGMEWIRIDRYYTSDMTKAKAKEDHVGKIDMYHQMEVAEANPQVVFQPMMCQHCNHAPCETVCPVAATTHSSEGLNMMAYNRCVGTRYCANNCPYKVRRFNWFKYSDNKYFDYNMNNNLGKMVLNPDVVVRSRGVMEKCTMCVQRLQYGKLEAKKEKRRPVDGEIKTACAQTCPTQAITFGDFNDKKSKLSAASKDERSYTVLEELNVQPNILYQVKVRNTKAKKSSGGHH